LCIGVKLSPHSAEAASGRCLLTHDSNQSSAFGNMTALSSSLPYSRYYRSNSLSDHRPAYATTPNLSTKLRSTSVNDSLLSTSRYRRIISHVIGCLIFATYEGRDACSIGAQALCTEYNCRTFTKLVSCLRAGSRFKGSPRGPDKSTTVHGTDQNVACACFRDCQACHVVICMPSVWASCMQCTSSTSYHRSILAADVAVSLDDRFRSTRWRPWDQISSDRNLIGLQR